MASKPEIAAHFVEVFLRKRDFARLSSWLAGQLGELHLVEEAGEQLILNSSEKEKDGVHSLYNVVIGWDSDTQLAYVLVSSRAPLPWADSIAFAEQVSFELRETVMCDTDEAPAGYRLVLSSTGSRYLQRVDD